jgi:MFS family permease
VAATPLVVPLLLLAAGASVWLLCVGAFFSGAGIAVLLTLWLTVFQREVPEHAQSRVSSYDALGSFVLIPLGAVLAGPVAAAIGEGETLVGAAVVCVTCWSVMLLIPSVWAIRGHARERPTPAPYGV